MSVTFWAPDAPTTRQQPYPDSSPEYWCDVSSLPEVNLANGNARAMLVAMGLPDDECGQLLPAEMPPVVRRLLELVNDDVSRASVTQPDELWKGCRLVARGEAADRMMARMGFGAPAEGSDSAVPLQSGPTMFAFGRSDDYVARTAGRLLDLFVQAKQADYRVCWG